MPRRWSLRRSDAAGALLEIRYNVGCGRKPQGRLGRKAACNARLPFSVSLSLSSSCSRGGLCGISIPRDERAFGQTAHVRARVRPRSAPLQRALSRLRARRPRRRGFPLSERGLEVGRLRGELLFPSPLTTRAGRARPQKLPLEPRLGTAHRQRVVVRASYKKTAERHRAVVSRWLSGCAVAPRRFQNRAARLSTQLQAPPSLSSS